MDEKQGVDLKYTPLNHFHKEMQARMVPFAGYEMPIQYSTGIKAEHQHSRTQASLFDISHMGQILISGDHADKHLETLVPGNIQGLLPNQQIYSVLTNENGGVIDDLMITRLGNFFSLVVNASLKTMDYEYLKDSLGEDIELTLCDGKALLALQGPLAADILTYHASGIDKLPFLVSGGFTISGIECLVHRCGYTGEDGFEISVKADSAEDLVRIILNDDRVLLAGLGARDTLRLEAGLCLYGHELDEDITPIEADLDWVIARKYRAENLYNAKFPGAKRILKQLLNGPKIIRRGFKLVGRVPVREGAIILDSVGKKVGIITSGGYGPTVGGPIAMGYINTESLQSKEFKVSIRGSEYILKMVGLPFVKHRYFRK